MSSEGQNMLQLLSVEKTSKVDLFNGGDFNGER